MDNVWYSISRLVFELHPARVKEIANKIEKMNSITDLKTIKPFTDSKIDENLIEDFIECWKQVPEVSPLQISSAMQSAAATASILETNQQIEVVWTGPDTGLVSSRNTEQVLYELIALASDRIFLVSYVSYNVERLIDELSKASEKGIKINILLEPSQEYGGKLDFDTAKSFRDHISKVNLYLWNKEKNSYKGVVHAKCAIADDKIAFITSANLTGAAMEKNMELGLLIKGGKVPRTLDKHFQSLIQTNVIKPFRSNL